MKHPAALPTDIRIREVQPHFIDTRARIPLKFGSVVVTECTFCQTRVRVENRACAAADGWGGIFLMDLWSWPTTAETHERKDRAMREIVRRYARLFASHPVFSHPVDIFMEVSRHLASIKDAVCADMGIVHRMPDLGDLVCASSIDGAVHDAFGVVNGRDTYTCYGRDLMSSDLSRWLGSPFEGRYLGEFVLPIYAKRIPVFHLVGGLDKLRKTELDETDPTDGIPNTLDEWVARDGLRCLKVKLKGTDLAWDLERILEVTSIAHEVRDRAGGGTLAFSADTNEQCREPDYIVELLTKLKARSDRAFQELLYVEQPTERDLRLHRFDMRKVAALKPVILDESLVGFEDFALAMELGWSGIALKSCKCHSKALLFAALAASNGVPYTVQDLTNTGLALLHSVGLAARLRPMMGVEANSSQFFPAASAPEGEVHPGIVTRRDGMLSTESLIGPGLGFQISRIRRELPEGRR